MTGYYDHSISKTSAPSATTLPTWPRNSSTTTGPVFEDGALTSREKALIALGVAHAVQCPYCIEAYTKSTLEKGCDPEQLTETAHVACAIRGGASLVHGMQMRDVVDKLSM